MHPKSSARPTSLGLGSSSVASEPHLLGVTPAAVCPPTSPSNLRAC